MKNLAGNPEHLEKIDDLKQRLTDWMASQGDFGLYTEKAAHSRQPKHTQENRRYSESEMKRLSSHGLGN